jgi:hypothetical protein
LGLGTCGSGCFFVAMARRVPRLSVATGPVGPLRFQLDYT